MAHNNDAPPPGNISIKDHKLRGMRDFPYFAKHNLFIRPKEGGRAVLSLNSAQLIAHNAIEKQRAETGKVRMLILKGRQQGISTLVEARYYWRVTHRKGVRAFILTHHGDSTAKLFEMVEHYHDNCPAHSQPSVDRSNAKELKFSHLGSGYEVGTAGSAEVGRGGTIQYFHGSEVAFWANADIHARGVLQCVPDMPDTEIIFESTANGMGNYFHKQWQRAQRGEGEFIAVFIPWFIQTEYMKCPPAEWQPEDDELEYLEAYMRKVPEPEKMARLWWRHCKIADDFGGDPSSFDQEYPATPEIAFQRTGEASFIRPIHIMAARGREGCAAFGPMIGGFDPSGDGQDSTAFIVRHGAWAGFEERWAKTTPMECVGLCIEKIKLHGLRYLMIDILNMGQGIYSRLCELNYGNILIPVNFGAASFWPKQYKNKRAECWGKMRDWLADEDLPPHIPDDDILHQELAAPWKIPTSTGVLQLCPKEKLQSSPDLADALALTFALPTSNLSQEAAMTSSHDDFLDEHTGLQDVAEGYTPLL